MKRIKDFLVGENTLYTTPEEKAEFVADTSNIINAFAFNFLGILGLHNIAIASDDSASQKRVKTYFKSDLKLRLDSITDENLNISLILKLMAENGFFISKTPINEMTRFLVIARKGTLGHIDNDVIRKWVSQIKPSAFSASDTRIKTLLNDFISKDISLEQLAYALKGMRIRHKAISIDYWKLAKKVDFSGLDSEENNIIDTPEQDDDIDEPEFDELTSQRPATPEWKLFDHTTGMLNFLTTEISWSFGDRKQEQELTRYKNSLDRFVAEPADRPVAVYGTYLDEISGYTLNLDDPDQRAQIIQNANVLSFITERLLDTVYIPRKVLDVLENEREFIDKLYDTSLLTKEQSDSLLQIIKNAYRSGGGDLGPLLTRNSIYLADIVINFYDYKSTFLGVTGEQILKDDIQKDGGLSFEFKSNFLDTVSTASEKSEYASVIIKIDQYLGDRLFGGASATGERIDVVQYNYYLGYTIATESDTYIDKITDSVINSFEQVFARIFRNDTDSREWRSIVSHLTNVVIPNYQTAFDSINNIPKIEMDDIPNAADNLDRAINSMTIVSEIPLAVSLLYGLIKPQSCIGDSVKNAILNYLGNIASKNPVGVGEDSSVPVETRLEIINASNDPDSVIESMRASINNRTYHSYSSVYKTKEVLEIYYEYMVSVGKSVDFDNILLNNKSLVREMAQNIPNVFRNRSMGPSGDDFRRKLFLAMYTNAENEDLKAVLPGGNIVNGFLANFDFSSDFGLEFARLEAERGFPILSLENIKDISRRRDKQDAEGILFDIMYEAYERDPQLSNKLYDNLDKPYQTKMRNRLTGVGAIAKELKTSAIQPFANINGSRIKDILSFNNLDAEEIAKQFKVRAKKNESFTEYAKRSDEEIKDSPLEPLKVDEIDYTSTDLADITKSLVERHHAAKHGDIYPMITKAFSASFDNSEYEEFMAMVKDRDGKVDQVIPAFHGTGGVAAGMILRYGFTVVPSTDESVVGRMLGDGIYFSNKIDKCMQYVGNSGFTRASGIKGYIIDMESVLGSSAENEFGAAGVGSSDGIRSPEWAVRNPTKQLKVMNVYEVEMTNFVGYQRYLRAGGINEDRITKKRFSMLLKEASTPDSSNLVIYRFYDGRIPKLENGEVVSVPLRDYGSDNPNVNTYFVGDVANVEIKSNKFEAYDFLRMAKMTDKELNAFIKLTSN